MCTSAMNSRQRIAGAPEDQERNNVPANSSTPEGAKCRLRVIRRHRLATGLGRLYHQERTSLVRLVTTALSQKPTPQILAENSKSRWSARAANAALSRQIFPD